MYTNLLMNCTPENRKNKIKVARWILTPNAKAATNSKKENCPIIWHLITNYEIYEDETDCGKGKFIRKRLLRMRRYRLIQYKDN